jgi:hypothetical protein
MRKYYKRVETISKTIAEDHVTVTDDTMERFGTGHVKSESYHVQWFDTSPREDVEIPESDQLFHDLEAEFHKLPEEE